MTAPARSAAEESEGGRGRAGATGTAQLCAELRAFEQGHGLFAREIDGIPYWELTRYPLFCELAVERGLWGRGDGEVAGTRPRPRSPRRALEFLAHLARGALPPAGAPLLVVGHPRRKLARDGTWWDPHLDRVADRCREHGLGLVFVEPPHRGRFHYRPAHTPGLVYLDRELVRSRLRPGRRAGPSDAEALELAELGAALRSELDTRVSLERSVRWRLQRFRDDRHMWRRILGRLRPRVVLLTAGAGQEGLVAAARERGTLCVELQHGTPVADKLNYDYDRGDRPRRYFADYFASYGEYWKERGSWPIDSERVFVLGSPTFQRARRELEAIPKRREIVVLSQATVGLELARFAAALSRALPERWRILYKLHPEELGSWRERTPCLRDTRIEVVSDREAELHPLLARAEVQVGVYSTALYEGIGLGCKTVLVDLPGVECMRDLVERGMAAVVSDVADFEAVCARLPSDRAWAPLLFGSDWEAKLDAFLGEELGLPLGRAPQASGSGASGSR